ncbi:MAG: S8 family serine peptidase, partial [Pseudomonadota bacterium]
MTPEAVDWANLPPFEWDDFEPFVFHNRTNETLTLSYIEIDNGPPNAFLDTVVPAGQSAYAWGFEGESWFVASLDGTVEAVLIDPVDEEVIDYRGAPLDWQEGRARINHGQLISVAEEQTSIACTNNNAAAIEVFFTPGDNIGVADIASRRGNGRDHFVLRQLGNRLQAIVGIQNGAIYAYSNAGSVAPGQPVHVVVSRDKNGHVRLFVNGVQQGYSGINRSTPLVWEGAAVTALGDANDGWSGEFDAFAVHCGDLWRSKAQAHFAEGPDAYTTINDAVGHGTHVAGTIAGTGEASDGELAGIAPGAAVYDLRILDEHGKGTVASALSAFDWLLGNADSEGIRIVNLSIGKAVESAGADDLLVQGVEALVESGLVVVASAGNYGKFGN